jgi:uncharacterized membrane protein YhaH (DUF805 family)
VNWFVLVLKKYATFSGRARRQEYWMYFLIYFLISVVLMLVDGILHGGDLQSGTGLLSGLFALGTLLPGIAVGVRRLHDTGRSGWWLLVSFIPLIGGLVLLVFLVRDSQPGDNAWGPSPKAGVQPY